MEKRTIELILFIITLIIVLFSIFTAVLFTPLVPTDVATVVRKPEKFERIEHRVKGVVSDWDGDSTFNLTDVSDPNIFQISVIHEDGLSEDFGSGKTVFVTGVISDTENFVFTSTKVEVDDEDPDLDAGWVAPYAQKIFYFHVPAAWVSFVAFGVVLVMSILFLKTSLRKWDMIAHASAEVGVVFCTLAILTGPIWGKAEWDEFWRWSDTKLTITFILWLIFIAYLILRSGVESEEKARLAAVFGIIGFVCVPLSFVSSRIWQSMHPNIVATSEGSMSPETGIGLLVGVIAFTFLYIFLLLKRIHISEISSKIEDLKEKIGGI